MSGAADERCARCGGAFHCGANDAVPCACTTIALDATVLAALRERYAGCLCLACLGEVQRDSAARAEAPSA
jgi:Cysteine-rich CWC